LEFTCTNNQVEYEAFQDGLTHLKQMGVGNVEVSGILYWLLSRLKGRVSA
jgi:hypothetical protein